MGSIAAPIGMTECTMCVEVKVWVEVSGVKAVGLALVRIDSAAVGLGVGLKG